MTAAADPALPLDGQPDELAIQRAGLAAIRSGQHLTPIELGVAADVDPMRAQAIIDGLLGRQAATVSGGRVDGIAGLTSDDGRVTIMMPHPERVIRTVQNSWHPDDWGEAAPWLRLFYNARAWVN